VLFIVLEVRRGQLLNHTVFSFLTCKMGITEGVGTVLTDQMILLGRDMGHNSWYL
jgi:hypothetical protein